MLTYALRRIFLFIPTIIGISIGFARPGERVTPATLLTRFDSTLLPREPWIIRRDLTRTHVAATDRRAIFVGPESPIESRCSTLESRPGRSPHPFTSMTAWAKACGASWGKL